MAGETSTSSVWSRLFSLPGLHCLERRSTINPTIPHVRVICNDNPTENRLALLNNLRISNRIPRPSQAKRRCPKKSLGDVQATPESPYFPRHARESPLNLAPNPGQTSQLEFSVDMKPSPSLMFRNQLSIFPQPDL